MGIDGSPEMKKAVLLGRDVVLNEANEAVVRDGRMARGSPEEVRSWIVAHRHIVARVAE